MKYRSLLTFAAGLGLVAALSSPAEAQYSVTAESFSQTFLPGDEVVVNVNANTNTDAVVSFEIDLSFDDLVFSSMTYTTAFDALQDVSIDDNPSPGNIIIAGAVPVGSAGVVLAGQPLLTLTFTLDPAILEDIDTDVLVNAANFDETDAAVSNGTISLYDEYGDVTGDGSVSALDASNILQEVVGKVPSDADFNDPRTFEAGDVTGNFDISALDAAYVLGHVVAGGSFYFPVQMFAPAKAAPLAPVSLSWVENNGGFDLVASDPTNIMAGELSLTVSDDINVSGQYVASNRSGNSVLVAFVAIGNNSPVLFHVDGAAIAPAIDMVNLNEGAITVENVATAGRPAEFALAQNAPNPFNPSTTIQYNLPESGSVRLAIYNTQGQLVRTLVDGQATAGSHEVTWDARDNRGAVVASGVYLYRLTTSQNTQVRRMILAR